MQTNFQLQATKNIAIDAYKSNVQQEIQLYHKFIILDYDC